MIAQNFFYIKNEDARLNLEVYGQLDNPAVRGKKASFINYILGFHDKINFELCHSKTLLFNGIHESFLG